MANNCTYDMKVIGTKENIITLSDWLSANYNYADGASECYVRDGEEKIPMEHHIGYRVFSANLLDLLEGEECIGYIFGDCAWSVYCCMFEGIDSYMADCASDKNERKAISILEAARALDLDIEIFSEEPGMAFSEHYIIRKGELEVEETEDCIIDYDSDLEYIGIDCVFWSNDEGWKWEI